MKGRMDLNKEVFFYVVVLVLIAFIGNIQSIQDQQFKKLHHHIRQHKDIAQSHQQLHRNIRPYNSIAQPHKKTNQNIQLLDGIVQPSQHANDISNHGDTIRYHNIIHRHRIFRREANSTTTDGSPKCGSTCIIIAGGSVLFVFLVCLAGAIYYATCAPHNDKHFDSWDGKELARTKPLYGGQISLRQMSDNIDQLGNVPQRQNLDWTGGQDEIDYAAFQKGAHDNGIFYESENLQPYPFTIPQSPQHLLPPHVQPFQNFPVPQHPQHQMDSRYMNPIIYPGYPDFPVDHLRHPMVDPRQRIYSTPNMNPNEYNQSVDAGLIRAQTMPNNAEEYEHMINTKASLSGKLPRKRIQFQQDQTNQHLAKFEIGDNQIDENEYEEEQQYIAPIPKINIKNLEDEAADEEDEAAGVGRNEIKTEPPISYQNQNIDSPKTTIYKSIPIEQVDTISDYSDPPINRKQNIAENTNNEDAKNSNNEEEMKKESLDNNYNSNDDHYNDKIRNRFQLPAHNENLSAIETERLSVVYTNEFEDKTFFKSTNLMTPAHEDKIMERILVDEV